MQEEKVLGVIPNASLSTGFLRSKLYTLVVTNRRIIAARVTKDLIKKEKLKRKAEASKEGHGRFRQMLRSFMANFTFSDRYLDIIPEEILSETPDNFFVAPEDIIETKLTEGIVTEDEDGNTSQYPHSLYIKTNKNRYKFSFNGNFAEIKNLLNRIEA